MWNDGIKCCERKQTKKTFRNMRENVTDLADVAKLPMGWASDRRVNQTKHAVSVFICAFKSVSGFCRGDLY